MLLVNGTESRVVIKELTEVVSIDDWGCNKECTQQQDLLTVLEESTTKDSTIKLLLKDIKEMKLKSMASGEDDGDDS